MGRFAPLAIVALPALILADTLVGGRPPLFGVRAGDVYGAHRDVFDFLRARLTPQDRVLIVGGQPALALMAKAGTLFAVPNIHDYDPLASQRYAEYFNAVELNSTVPPKLERLARALSSIRLPVRVRCEGPPPGSARR